MKPLGRELTEMEIVDLYIKHPKIFIDFPSVVIKDYKNTRVMFMVIDKRRYVLEENKTTKKVKWYEQNGNKN